MQCLNQTLYGSNSRELPLVTISDPHGLAGPILGGTGAPEPSVAFLLEGSVLDIVSLYGFSIACIGTFVWNSQSCLSRYHVIISLFDIVMHYVLEKNIFLPIMA